jgi:hypothetical protein
VHTATCHCGSVRVEVPRKPRRLTSCNCSICRRYGALWAYYRVADVVVLASPGATARYGWGDRTLSFVRCTNCGCVTHYVPSDPRRHPRMAVNARNFEPQVVAAVRIWHFDGAATWRYLD